MINFILYRVFIRFMSTQDLKNEKETSLSTDRMEKSGEIIVGRFAGRERDADSNPATSDKLNREDFEDGLGDYRVRELPRFSQYLHKDAASRYQAIILNVRQGNYGAIHFAVGLAEIENSDHRNGVVHALRVSPFQVSFQSLGKEFYEQLFEELYNPQAQSRAIEQENKKKSQMTKNWGEGQSLLSPEEIRSAQAASEADFVDEAEEWIELTDLEEYERNIKRNEAELTTQEFIRLILMEFLRSGSSDLHLEAGQPTGRIRFRYDSEMFVRWDNIPFVKIKQLAMGMAETARKDASQMKFKDIDSTIKVRTFRDGEIVEVELRFASQPTLYAPSIVLRSQLKPIRDIEEVGFLPHQIADLKAA